MNAEIAKCEMNNDATAFGLPCPVHTNNVSFQECAAVYLSLKYYVRNPLKLSGAATGWTASKKYCPTVATGNAAMGVGSGDGEVDGLVSIVICPRSPYCSSNPKTDGKFKVMWWWNNKTMQDYAIVEPNNYSWQTYTNLNFVSESTYQEYLKLSQRTLDSPSKTLIFP